LEQSNLEGVSVAFGIQHSLREMVTGWGWDSCGSGQGPAGDSICEWGNEPLSSTKDKTLSSHSHRRLPTDNTHPITCHSKCLSKLWSHHCQCNKTFSYKTGTPQYSTLYVWSSFWNFQLEASVTHKLPSLTCSKTSNSWMSVQYINKYGHLKLEYFWWPCWTYIHISCFFSKKVRLCNVWWTPITKAIMNHWFLNFTNDATSLFHENTQNCIMYAKQLDLFQTH
jgi:hypothetical protein